MSIISSSWWLIDYDIILIIDFEKLIIDYGKGKKIFLIKIPPYANV